MNSKTGVASGTLWRSSGSLPHLLCYLAAKRRTRAQRFASNGGSRGIPVAQDWIPRWTATR